MATKVFVGGLSWDTTDEGLRRAFEQFGEIEDARIIMDRDTGRSRGFAFITFPDKAAARQAISEMDGQDLDGRSIRVNEAEDKPKRDFGGGDRGGRGDYGRGQRNNRY